jgi:Rho GTPase-activating protein RGD1
LADLSPHFNRQENNQDIQRITGSSNGSQSFLPAGNYASSPTQQIPIAYPSSQVPGTYSSSNPPSASPISSTQPPATYSSSNQIPAAYSSSPQIPVSYPSQSQPPATYASSNPPAQTSTSSLPRPSDQPGSSISPTPTSTFIPPLTLASASNQLDKNTTTSQLDHSSPSGQFYPSGSVEPYKPSTPKGHTFGASLDEVLSRENATLPLIVAQCVIAVDQFGITSEGIYRVSGTTSNLAKLKHLFDFEPDNIDFRTPTGFFGDIHAVAGILKQYLRELPEPLLTREYYKDFIEVARISPI